MSLFVLFFVAPQFAMSNYRFLGICVRVFNMVCLLYISVHTLRSHLEAKDSKTILTPFGFIFLGIGQYSLLIWSLEGGDVAFYGGLTLRWIGLSLFLLTAYRSFYGKQRSLS
jgi:apolipoprotein N-acyltransferase